jgi:hypothetical protein
MTVRSEQAQRAAERKARTMARMVERALSPRRRGLDGLAKKVVAAKLGPIVPDPELDHDAFDLDDDGLRVGP